MKDKKIIQAEDSPTIEEPKKTQPSVQPETSTEPGRSFFKKALPWVIVALVFFIGGMCLIYFTIYQETSQQLTLAKSKVDEQSTQLSQDQLDLTKAKTDLSTAQKSLTDANNQMVKDTQLLAIYKFQGDVNQARVSLLKLDPSSARQALSVAGDDLKALSATNISQDSIAGLQPQIDMALTNLESDPAKAISALDTLYTNLLLLSNSLQ